MKVREKSGNLLVKSNALRTISSQKWKKVENKEENVNDMQKKLEQFKNGIVFSLIKAQ